MNAFDKFEYVVLNEKEVKYFLRVNKEVVSPISKIILSCEKCTYKYNFKEGMLYIDFDNAIRDSILFHLNINFDKDVIKNLERMKEKLSSGRLHFKLISGREWYILETSFNRGKYASSSNNLKTETLELIDMYLDYFSNSSTYSKVECDVKDAEKLELFVAYKMMDKTKRALDNKNFDEYHRGIEYLKDYLKRYEGNYLKFVVDGKTYNILDIRTYMRGFFQEKKENKEENDSIVEMHDYSFFPLDPIESKKTIKSLIGKVQNSNQSNYLKDLLFRKIELYTSIDYVRIHLGKDSFDGYIGFELESGIVVLDKLFEDLVSLKIAHDYAIYVTDISNFEKITKMSRSKAVCSIRYGELDARRVMHNKKFREKVMHYVNNGIK